MANHITYRSSRAKLEWAQSQMNILEQELESLVKQQDNSAFFKMGKEKGELLIQGAQIHDVPDILSVHVGRIIGALRSALDNLIVQTVQTADPTVNTRNTVFPISGNTEKPGCHKWMGEKIRGLPTSYRDIVVDAKPYRGGNDKIFAIHSLRNEDEHLAINIVALRRNAVISSGAHFVVVKSEGADGKIIYTPTVTQFPDEFSVQTKIEFSGGAAGGWEVVPAISDFIAAVGDIIQKFEAV